MFLDKHKIDYYVYAGPMSQFAKSEEILNHPVLLAIENGSFEFEIGREVGQASFGDLVFCPSGINFKRRALSEITFYHIHFQKMVEKNNATQVPFGKMSISDVSRLSSTFSYLRSIQQNLRPSPVHPQKIDIHLISDLLILCEMELLYSEEQNEESDPLIEHAIRYMHQNAFDKISLKEIAEKLGMKQSQLTRRFQAAYGVSPVSYLTNIKLGEAKKLLLGTNDTLESIAYQCGYESGSYLCRVFTEKVGANPSVFRQKYRI